MKHVNYQKILSVEMKTSKATWNAPRLPFHFYSPQILTVSSGKTQLRSVTRGCLARVSAPTIELFACFSSSSRLSNLRPSSEASKKILKIKTKQKTIQQISNNL